MDKQRFNAVLVKKRKIGDVKKIEKIIDDEKKKEKIEDEAMNAKIHSWNPNKGYWRN